MKIDFSQKRLDKILFYFRISSMTPSPKFYQILRKIPHKEFFLNEEFPKNFPSNIWESVKDTTMVLDRLKHNYNGHLQYFFHNFLDKGLGNAVAPKFRKKRWGVNG